MDADGSSELFVSALGERSHGARPGCARAGSSDGSRGGARVGSRRATAATRRAGSGAEAPARRPKDAKIMAPLRHRHGGFQSARTAPPGSRPHHPPGPAVAHRPPCPCAHSPTPPARRRRRRHKRPAPPRFPIPPPSTGRFDERRRLPPPVVQAAATRMDRPGRARGEWIPPARGAGRAGGRARSLLRSRLRAGRLVAAVGPPHWPPTPGASTPSNARWDESRPGPAPCLELHSDQADGPCPSPASGGHAGAHPPISAR
jgi:hypothetical protein